MLLKLVPPLLIALDDLGRTNIGIVRIQACIPTCPPLTQQIPTLVERDLDFAKVGDVFLGRRRSGVSSLQRMLVLDELADPVNDLDLVHACLLPLSGHDISTAPKQVARYSKRRRFRFVPVWADED